MKIIELRKFTSITFHWFKGHVSLEGNERAHYVAKIAACYNPAIAYDENPISRESWKITRCVQVLRSPKEAFAAAMQS